MKNIYLTGMRGTGKTTIGKRLANQLGRPFIDMDEEMVAREGMSITDIVLEYGWTFFRDKERLLVEELTNKDGQVVSTGGGVLTSFENAEDMKESGQIILLIANPETIVRHLEPLEDRPSLTGGDVLEEISEIWESRKKTYMEYSDIIINTDNKSIDEVLEEIMSLIINHS